jgi:hypothetical protein
MRERAFANRSLARERMLRAAAGQSLLARLAAKLRRSG